MGEQPPPGALKATGIVRGDDDGDDEAVCLQSSERDGWKKGEKGIKEGKENIYNGSTLKCATAVAPLS